MILLDNVSPHSQKANLSRVKLFFALSRTPHGLLDMTAPAFGALLWLGAFPHASTVVIGLLTAFAGYTAVYALNDVVDYRNDQDKISRGCLGETCGDLDAVFVRHPMAQGLLSYKEGMIWATGWSLVALVGAYLLNPVCAFMFLAGCILEAAYCFLWRVSPFRTVVNGCVKTLGPLAAVFAVDPAPSPAFLMVLFLCLFLWEIGGQNIPNDLMDVEDDRKSGGQTVPVRYGGHLSRFIILLTLSLSVALSGILMMMSAGGSGFIPLLAALAAGLFLLILPAFKLYQVRDNNAATMLFNWASYFPMALLGIVIFNIVL